MTQETHIKEDPSSAAAEYVLGLLTPPDRAAFVTLLRTSSELQAEVAWWEAHFAGLTETVKEVRPPRGTKKRLLQELFPDTAKQRRTLRPMFGWAGLTSGFLTVGLMSMVLYLALPTTSQGPAPLLAGQIVADDSSFTVFAVYEPDAAALRLRRVADTVPADRDLEIWVIAGGAAPLSLGVLPQSSEARVPMPKDLSLDGGALTLAISEEPLGGSTTGTPTGPIRATGALIPL